MKRLIIVLAILAVFTSLCGGSAQTAAPSKVKGAPGYARVLGVVIGWSTTEDLEARIGRGEVMVGGHPNSGRYWRFTRCEITTDAFERRGNNEMIDWFVVNGNKGRLSTLHPFSRDKRWPLRDLVFGERMTICEAKLKRAGMAMTHTKYGLERVDVRKIVVGKLSYYQQYTLSITGGKYLRGIDIKAAPENGTVATPLREDYM